MAKRIITCVVCNNPKPYHAKNMCKTCYWKQYHINNQEERNERKRHSGKKYRIEHVEEEKKRHREYYIEHVEEERERGRQWRATHREERRTYNKQYRVTHPEEIKQYQIDHLEERMAYNKQYRTDHPEEFRQYGKEYRAAHTEEVRERNKQYHLTNREENNERSRQYRDTHLEEIQQYRRDHPAEKRDYVVPAGQCRQLNKWFEGCKRHHVDTDTIIHIPTEIHVTHAHSIKTGRGMDSINALAFAFLNGRKEPTIQTTISIF